MWQGTETQPHHKWSKHCHWGRNTAPPRVDKTPTTTYSKTYMQPNQTLPSFHAYRKGFRIQAHTISPLATDPKT
jgi:hypothetical protein